MANPAFITVRRYGKYICRLRNRPRDVKQWIIDNVAPAGDIRDPKNPVKPNHTTMQALMSLASSRHFTFGD